MKATNMIAQCTLRSPKRSMSVIAMRVAAPDSAIIFPSIVPSATTMAMKPRTLPTPSWNALTAAPGDIPDGDAHRERDADQREERMQLETRDEHDERDHGEKSVQKQTGVSGHTDARAMRAAMISSGDFAMSITHACSSGDGTCSASNWLSSNAGGMKCPRRWAIRSTITALGPRR